MPDRRSLAVVVGFCRNVPRDQPSSCPAATRSGSVLAIFVLATGVKGVYGW